MSDAVAAAWTDLAGLPRPSLAELFADPARLDLLSAKLDLPGGAIRFDWSKTHLDAAHLAGFTALAEAVGFKRARGAMFAGEPINVTEGRAVEHTAQPPSPHAAYRYSPRFCTCKTSCDLNGRLSPSQISTPGCSCACSSFLPCSTCLWKCSWNASSWSVLPMTACGSSRSVTTGATSPWGTQRLEDHVALPLAR